MPETDVTAGGGEIEVAGGGSSASALIAHFFKKFLEGYFVSFRQACMT